ncbi:MAG: tetraacyldisaccharide 4'-kinase [Polyangiaceae bacterium]|jgi:tetraacyldisaccharide 4'-kinase|nr:tetraacyldisaccharide 4'-kinase [Polyangiaceae bacterium]
MTFLRAIERFFARSLERGLAAPGLDHLASGWAWGARRERRIHPDPSRRWIGVEGATLGGSWKTPVSLAMAEALGKFGEKPVFWSHGYGGRSKGLVGPGQGGREVGDEAALAARRLAVQGIEVWSGEAPREGRVVVADGARLHRGDGVQVVLALDDERPWGAGRCPPAGDLRAPAGHLLGVASQVVRVGAGPAAALEAGVWRARWWLDLPPGLGRRVAVVTAIARPGRFVGGLERAGFEVVSRIELPDHGGTGVEGLVERGLRGCRAEQVLCTEKCREWLPDTVAGRQVVAVPLGLELPPGLVEEVLRGLR